VGTGFFPRTGFFLRLVRFFLNLKYVGYIAVYQCELELSLRGFYGNPVVDLSLRGFCCNLVVGFVAYVFAQTAQARSAPKPASSPFTEDCM